MSITTTRWITRLLVWLLIALGTAEALYGFGQLMGLWPSGHSLYRLTGSFYNPGPYMGYLALSLPLCLHEWMRPAQGFARWRQRAAMTAAALILCLLPAGMSRAAWAAATAAAGYVLWMHHRKRILRGMRRHRRRTAASRPQEGGQAPAGAGTDAPLYVPYGTGACSAQDAEWATFLRPVRTLHGFLPLPPAHPSLCPEKSH